MASRRWRRRAMKRRRMARSWRRIRSRRRRRRTASRGKRRARRRRKTGVEEEDCQEEATVKVV